MIDDDPIELRRRQRARAKRRNLTVAVLVGGFVFCGLVAAVIVLALRGGGLRGGPTESSEGESWTHKDLAEHLNKDGVRVQIRPAISLPGQIHAWFVAEGTPKDSEGSSAVSVVLVQTRSESRAMGAAQGDGGFSWGKFVFFAGMTPDSRHLYERIKVALGK